MTKYRKGPQRSTKDPQKTHKGPQRSITQDHRGSDNHEKTARLATILFNFLIIILFIFLWFCIFCVFFWNFGVLMNYAGLWNDHFKTPAQIIQSFCFLFCTFGTWSTKTSQFLQASGFWTVQDGQAAISRCWLLHAMQQRLHMPTRTQHAGRAASHDPLDYTMVVFQSATESRCFWWLRRRMKFPRPLHTDWLSESAGSQLSPAACEKSWRALEYKAPLSSIGANFLQLSP